MTESEKNELFKQLMSLEENKKEAILARIFGYFEYCQEFNKNPDSEKFFNIVKNFV